MSENLWIRDDFAQKVGVGEDGCVDRLEFMSIPYRIKECLVRGWECINVFSATIIRSQLKAMDYRGVSQSL